MKKRTPKDWRLLVGEYERGIESPFPHQTIYFGADTRGAAPPLHLVAERPASGEVQPEEGERPLP